MAYPEKNVPTRIESGCIDAGVLGFRSVDYDAACESRNRTLHDLGVLFVAGQCVHNDKVDW